MRWESRFVIRLTWRRIQQARQRVGEIAGLPGLLAAPIAGQESKQVILETGPVPGH